MPVAFFIIFILFTSCQSKDSKQAIDKDSMVSCDSSLPSKFSASTDTSFAASGNSSTEGMVLIPAGTFMMGANDEEGRPDEYPQHEVSVVSFWMDETEVTNAQFEEFIRATGYITTAEKKPDWEELKKQLPPGTPKPDDNLLVASSLVFTPPANSVPLDNASRWWSWKPGADWKHPQGPKSDIRGKENYPVVHISWDDAMAYCKWSGKRLPTEAEWEWASRGGLSDNLYPWGNDFSETQNIKANTWQGSFPSKNLLIDKYYNSAPVRTFSANRYGLYDMAGNVWEWCSDWYREDYYNSIKEARTENPRGPSSGYDQREPMMPKRVIRGGSFLCNASYCKGYRVTARMKASPDTGLEHTGFRCVKEIK